MLLAHLVNRSSECPLISFDKDHPNPILSATITDSMASSFTVGTKIVFKMSLPTAKSRARSNPPAKRNLIFIPLELGSSFNVRLSVLTYAIKAMITEIPIITPVETSIPNVM